jgi:hypothetical protein
LRQRRFGDDRGVRELEREDTTIVAPMITGLDGLGAYRLLNARSATVGAAR